MRAQRVALLFVAAFAHSGSGAVIREPLHHPAPRFFPSSNSTTSSSTTTISTSIASTSSTTSTTSTLSTELLSSSSSDNDERTTSLGDRNTGTASVTMGDTTTISRPSTLDVDISSNFKISVIPDSTSSANSNLSDPASTFESTASGETDGQRLSTSSTSSVPSHPAPLPPPFTSTCIDSPGLSQCPPPVPSSTGTPIEVLEPTNSTVITTPTRTCTTLNNDDPVTEYSIVYTETVTFMGNRSDYQPPYKIITTPYYCPTFTDLPPEPSAGFSTLSSTSKSRLGQLTSSKLRPTSCSQSSCDSPSAPDYEKPPQTTDYKGRPDPVQQPSLTSTRVTLTFITTDKNPSVVFPSDPVPSFNRPGGGGLTAQDHASVPPDGNHDGPQSVNMVPLPEFTVTAKGEEVIINKETFSGLQPEETTVVTVDEGTFTILPTAIEGEGATIRKPRPADTAVSVLEPTSTSLKGLPVVLTGSEAVIDGTRFNIPPAGTTTTVKSEPVSIGPGKLTVGGQTLTFPAMGGAQTDVIVIGGEVMTAIGPSIYVFHTTTLTYGPGIPETTEVVDDDTITIGPTALLVHGLTMGGATAKETQTSYEIVGGATITKLSPSYVIIDGTTFTVGPGATSTTKVIGGETIIIGPNGVVVSTLTMTYPFGSSTITTINPSPTATEEFPIQTDGSDEDDESEGALTRPQFLVGMTGLCIAIGVLIWI